MKTIVIGSDDTISISLTSKLTGKGLDMTQNFTASGDVIACFQNADGTTASELSWSATGGAFGNTIIPDVAACGDFHINVPKEASSGWAENDAATIELVTIDAITGKRKKRNLNGIISVVPDGVTGC